MTIPRVLLVIVPPTKLKPVVPKLKVAVSIEVLPELSIAQLIDPTG